MKIKPSELEKNALRKQHKRTLDKYVADRIKAILLSDEGWSQQRVSQALRIRHETVRDYLQDYLCGEKIRPKNGESQNVHECSCKQPKLIVPKGLFSQTRAWSVVIGGLNLDILGLISKCCGAINGAFHIHWGTSGFSYMADPFSNRAKIIGFDAEVIKISNREQECLKLIMLGKTSKEIAYELHISYRTVEDHINSLRRKTGCAHKWHLVGMVSRLNFDCQKGL